MTWVLDQAVDWLGDVVRRILNLLWAILADTLFRLPDVTALPQVAALSRTSLVIANTGYVLLVMAAGLMVMAQGALQDRYGAGDLVPRLLFGLVAANLAVPVARAVITGANALVMGLTGRGIATDGALEQLRRLIVRMMTDPASALLTAAVGLVLIGLVAMLIVGWITRFVALVVLCGLAPLALACHGTPWTNPVARAWWLAIGGIGASVVLQAVTLNTTLSILLDPGAGPNPAGIDAEANHLLTLFLVACMLWFTARVPALVGQYLGQGGSRGSVMGAVVRLVVVQQLTRGLGRAVGSARAGRQAATPAGSGSSRSASAGAAAARVRAARLAARDGATPLTVSGRPDEGRRPGTTWVPPDPQAPRPGRHPGTRWDRGPASSAPARPAAVPRRAATDWAPPDPRPLAHRTPGPPPLRSRPTDGASPHERARAARRRTR